MHKRLKPLRAFAVTNDGVIEGVELRPVGKAIFACLTADPVSSARSMVADREHLAVRGSFSRTPLSNPVVNV